MYRKIKIIFLGLILIGINAYAAGDLVVNGQLGVGTSSPSGKVHIDSLNNVPAIRVDARVSVPPYVTNISASYSIQATQQGISGTRYTGYKGESILMGYGNVQNMIGAENVIVFNASGSGSTIDSAKGNTAVLRRGSLNTQNHTLTAYYGYHSYGQATAGGGAISGTDWRHAYYENLPNYGGAITTMSGLWVDQQTRGDTNYGVVLNGDGGVGNYGSAVVLGAGQNAFLYGKTDGVYVYDGTNETKISPHDPETGEWIYYSRNTRTGKVLRVNMEELIRDIEKLTGKKYLVETLAEDK